jgi:heterodisulfide reductase subunit A
MLKDLGREIGLYPSLLEIVDIRTPSSRTETQREIHKTQFIRSIVEMGIARLREADPRPPSRTEITQKALVVGGGVAGMTAALSIADHGFEVSLIERGPELGGNLRRIHRTLQGAVPREYMESVLGKLTSHSKIHVHPSSRILHSEGHVGRFLTDIEKEDGSREIIDHGVTILATGGCEARTQSYCYGQSDSILTQQELEKKLHTGVIDPSSLGIVAMIQCVDSRERETNYCSRTCCASALKNALALKEDNPDIDVYILYRDLMSYGFLETYFTRARSAGVIFIQYTLDRKPVVEVEAGTTTLTVFDAILGRDLQIKPDLLVLSTGIVPAGHEEIADIFGVDIDEDGFFREAESKWRPVDTMKDGVFICGMAHSPRFIDESIAMAEAAAQRALTILSRKRIQSSAVVAGVRHSLCSLCERCIAACPYGARWKDDAEDRIVVNEISCQGCGSCAAVCPNGASVMRGYGDKQMLAALDAACRDII